MTTTLSHFEVIRPPHELAQESVLEWIAAAHAESASDPAVGVSVLKRLRRIGLGVGKISKRGVSLVDCTHRNWPDMQIYKPLGMGIGERGRVFDEVATNILAQFYPTGDSLPSQLIHVTCTGYVAPSPAQKVVALHHAGKKTSVTHAYHMGCYASIPALKIAKGLEDSVDIVHTEICSLHMNPAFHTLDQLVIQSLFGDGFIKYSISKNEIPGLELLNLQEEILPDSVEMMRWVCVDWGMQMTLSKEIPACIVKALPAFVERLVKQAGIKKELCYFAIHPGGPKIIEQVASIMQLENWQFSHSSAVLQNYGNMSSATLPHIWAKMWDDMGVTTGTPIISLAFGPGLTLAGALLRCNR